MGQYSVFLSIHGVGMPDEQKEGVKSQYEEIMAENALELIGNVHVGSQESQYLHSCTQHSLCETQR